MACPACGCNETYQYNDGEDYDLGDELIRCAACGAIFELEDETPEVDELHPLAGLHINQGSMDAAADAYEAEYNAVHNATELTGADRRPR